MIVRQVAARSFPAVPLAVLPTPLVRLRRLEQALGHDVAIWMKRDDLTGLAFGGNKARKLELLVADALGSGADTLVTVGGAQSNHCRMTAAAGAAAGLDVHLVLGGDAPPRCSGNLLLDALAGATLHFAGTNDWAEQEARMAELVDQLRLRGRRPYAMPVGGSVALGAVAFAAGFLEFEQQVLASERNGVPRARPSLLVVASSSGGTQAGLELGRRLSTSFSGSGALRLVGMGVAKKGGPGLAQDVARLADEAATLVDAGLSPIAPAGVSICYDYMGPAYAVSTPGAREAIRLVARTEGIFLDPVYTGKAMAGLIDWIRTGRVEPGQNVVFWHTGGSVALFADEFIADVCP